MTRGKAKRSLGKLTALFCKTTRTVGRHSDGGGLYLHVRRNLSRSWVLKYSRNKRGHEMGLGAFSHDGIAGSSLAQAREKAAHLRSMLIDGIDPIAAHRISRVKTLEPSVQTFGSFADQFLQQIQSQFKNLKTAKDWKRNIEVHAVDLRPLALDAITTVDVLGVLQPIWSIKFKTARELRGKIERVFDAAAVAGYRSAENPARWKGNLDIYLREGNKRKKRHHKAPHYDDMPEIVRLLRAKQATGNLAAFALEFTILTAARTTEARAMKVIEIDHAKRVWRIPSSRMKTDEDHVVPLSDRALTILRELIPSAADPSSLVFRGVGSNEGLGVNAMLHILQSISPTMTTHGCRSTFRDWAGDCTDHAWEVAEAALSHAVGNEVEQAYRRGKALEKRRLLMADWASFINAG